jgi:hypothetical protein
MRNAGDEPLKKGTPRAVAALLALGLAALLAACYLPTHFKSEIRLGRSGDFALAYYGDLVWGPLYRDIREKRLAPDAIPGKVTEIQRDLARDPNFKTIESQGDGSFKVAYERQGRLQPSDMVTFVRRNAIILEMRASPDGRVTINGSSLKTGDAETATAMGLDIQGEFRIITDGLVTEHNATSVRRYQGYNLYIWKIDSAFSPAPHLVMHREGAWPPPGLHSRR